MKHSPYVAILLTAALLILPSPKLLAQESEATLQKIARTGEFVIGYVLTPALCPTRMRRACQLAIR